MERNVSFQWTVLAQHAGAAAVTLIALSIFVLCTVAALWFAGAVLVAGAQHNPVHAGLWVWWDAWSAYRRGNLPAQGRHLAGAAALGCLVAFGGPLVALHALRGQSAQRRLYGSARFASEAEIRAAGLL